LNDRTVINYGKPDLILATVSNSSGKNKSFTCHICGINFLDQLTLDAHKKKEHSLEAEPPAGVG